MRNMIVARPGTASAFACAFSKRSVNSNVPVADHRSTMPTMKPTSPSFVIQNAFTAARAAAGRSYQKPIRRYEQSPTNSQNTNIWTRPGAFVPEIRERVDLDEQRHQGHQDKHRVGERIDEDPDGRDRSAVGRDPSPRPLRDELPRPDGQRGGERDRDRRDRHQPGRATGPAQRPDDGQQQERGEG